MVRQVFPPVIHAIILISTSQSGSESSFVSEERMFYVSTPGKRRESVHCRLKIASVGSVIFSKSGNGGCMWLLELNCASSKKTDETRNWWIDSR